MFAVFRALDSLSANLLVVIDQVKTFALISWAQAVLLLAAIVPAYRLASLEGVAASRAFVSFISLIFLVGAIVRYRIVSWSMVATALIRPAIAGLIMAAFLMALRDVHGAPDTLSNIWLALTLFGKVILGAAIYATVLFAGWILSGRPDGIETIIIDKITSLFRRQ